MIDTFTGLVIKNTAIKELYSITIQILAYQGHKLLQIIKKTFKIEADWFNGIDVKQTFKGKRHCQAPSHYMEIANSPRS